MRNMKIMKTGQHLMQTTVIGNPYAPSVASFKDLKKVMLKDLTVETNHRGSYLLLRFICPAMRMTAIMNVAEDEAGTVMPFALYFQDPETTRTAESILKEKGIIILKEPYFKVGTNGQYAVRVDQPTDIIWLSEDDPRVPKKWRTKSASVLKPAEYWKKKGNDLVGAGKFFDAIEMYVASTISITLLTISAGTRELFGPLQMRKKQRYYTTTRLSQISGSRLSILPWTMCPSLRILRTGRRKDFIAAHLHFMV